MKPINFPEQNMVIAENQDEYLSLPAFRSDDGTVVSCWKLSLLERLKVLFTGKMYLQILTFGGALQPQLPSIDSPFIEIEEE